MSNLVICRFNKNHKMKVNKLYQHEEICPDKNKIDLVQCQFDLNHKIKKSELINHYKYCKNKPKLDDEIQREMLIAIRNKSSNISKLKETNTEKSGKKFPVGLNYLKKKQENNEFKKEMNKALNNSEGEKNDDIFYIENENNDLSLEISKDLDFEERINLTFNMENNTNLNKNNQNCLKKIENVEHTFGIKGKNEYDPNDSDLYVDEIKGNNQSFEYSF